MERPGELALDLLAEGLTGMKLWPFDYVAHFPGGWDNWRSFRGMFDPTIRSLGGHDITAADLDRALEPFRKIRKAVGDRMEIMVEGHGLWSLPAALKIARALEEFRPAWLEDLMRADDIDALAELRRGTTCPILASEYLATRYEYKPLLEKQAADIVMIDPTWAGGITECKKVCAMAEAYKRPVAMHDCTGPFTLYAGIHLAINATNAIYQEIGAGVPAGELPGPGDRAADGRERATSSRRRSRASARRCCRTSGRGRSGRPHVSVTRGSRDFRVPHPSGRDTLRDPPYSTRGRCPTPRRRSSTSPTRPASARRKVAWRILPLLFCLYVIAYLDRANVGFAKLQMQDDLGFSDTVFGWGVGLFFVGYLFLEIPGALLVEHWSARKWFARILVTWGFCSMAMALVETPTQFYVVRFLLGLAEAGFFPGVIVYFTHWFPRQDRARAMSGHARSASRSAWRSGRACPRCCSNRTGSTSRAGSGCSWSRARRRCCSGVAVPFLLTDRPRDAKWLTPDERDWLEATLEAERRAAAAAGTVSLRAGAPACGTCGCWRSALFATNIGGYVFVFWLRDRVKGLLAATGRDAGRDQRAELDRRRVPVRAGRGAGVGLVVRPHRGPQVALHRGAGRRGRCSWR